MVSILLTGSVEGGARPTLQGPVYFALAKTHQAISNTCWSAAVHSNSSMTRFTITVINKNLRNQTFRDFFNQWYKKPPDTCASSFLMLRLSPRLSVDANKNSSHMMIFFSLTKTFVYAIHRRRLQMLGRFNIYSWNICDCQWMATDWNIKCNNL